MTNPHLDELLRLPPSERLQAIGELWDSLESQADLFPLSDEERAELDRRIAEDEADPRPGVSGRSYAAVLKAGRQADPGHPAGRCSGHHRGGCLASSAESRHRGRLPGHAHREPRHH